MSVKNPFKAVTPYVVPPAFITAMLDHYAEHDVADAAVRVRDPEGSEWRHIGLSLALTGDWFTPLAGIGVLFAIQFNERILPGAVRDDHLAKRIAEISERQGYKPGRKEFAQIKDDVTFELLPKAFIKRSVVPVMLLRPHWMLVFTSSAKRAEDVLAVLRRLYAGREDFKPSLAIPPATPVGRFKEIALTTPGSDDLFEADSAAVLKGENKRTIRIKDRDIYGEEVQDLLASGYDVHELRLNYYPAGRGDKIGAQFVVTDKMVIKSIALDDQHLSRGRDAEEDTQDFNSFAWIVGEEYRTLIFNLFAAVGGLRMPDWSTDDDEL